jgi:hypothetical protein
VLAAHQNNDQNEKWVPQGTHFSLLNFLFSHIFLHGIFRGGFVDLA